MGFGHYLEYFRKSFLFERAERWDVKGRKHLGSPAKFYAEDVGLRNARLNFRQMERTHLMENGLYCELRRRVHAVDVGMIERVEKDARGKSVRRGYEIDFAVNSGFRKVYVQGALEMSAEVKATAERRSLMLTGDFFPQDHCDWRQRAAMARRRRHCACWRHPVPAERVNLAWRVKVEA